MKKIPSITLEQLRQALRDANTCLIENGEGPPALTPAQIRDLADPLHDDLLELIEPGPGMLATDEEIFVARQLYGPLSPGNIEIDADADRSESDDGVWIQAWVRVPKDAL
jgi:hypothetical protein